MMEENKQVWHMTRIRAKNEPDFYEPNTDIRKLFPAAADIAIRYLQNVYKDLPQVYGDLDYLYKCFKILQIRLAEDPSGLDAQLQEFSEAVRKAPAHVQMMWLHAQFKLLTAVYALFYRRDTKTDRKSVLGILEQASLILYKDVLSTETYALVEKELKRAGLLEGDAGCVVKKGLAVCPEDGHVVDTIKEAAVAFLGCDEGATWNQLADSLDAAFREKPMDDHTAMCVALAYPSYGHNDLTVTIEGKTENGTAGEAAVPQAT